MDQSPFAESSRDLTLVVLMKRYQRADPQATAELISTLSPRLFRFFLAQLGSRSEAEDLLQKTWLRIHRVRHTYRTDLPVVPWIFAVARNVRVDSYRKRGRIRHYENIVDTDKLSAQTEATCGEQIQSFPFKELVAGLSESQQEVITMLKVNGLSLEEVARATSSTVGAVKQRAHRAYEKLRLIPAAYGRAKSTEGQRELL